MDENGGLTSKHVKSLENLFGKFEGYCKEIAVPGFNLLGMTLTSSKSIFSKNCVNMVSNLILLSIRLESILVSRLNTLNSWTFYSVLPQDTISSIFSKLLVFQSKNVFFLRIILLMLIR